MINKKGQGKVMGEDLDKNEKEWEKRRNGKREEEGMGEDGNKNNKQGDGIGEGGENE